MVKAEKKFSLKDMLFNEAKVAYLADLIAAAYPAFETNRFQKLVLEKFPELELKQRIGHMAEVLKQCLPESFERAVSILVEALPPELDPTKTDDDFGDFIFAPLSEFVARYGCSENYFETSIEALKAITKRFSAEDAIRYFINAFPERTNAVMMDLAVSKNYHQRRLASEGSRPSLPWSQKIRWEPESILPILERLYGDPTRFVTRSVANNLNDISKIDGELVLQTLEKWENSRRQNPKEMAFIVRHALRTLLKRGHKEALKKMGFEEPTHVHLDSLKLPAEVVLGEMLEFGFRLSCKRGPLGKLRLEYAIHFMKANGKRSPKVFKISEGNVHASAMHFEKKHPLKAITTRAHYPGLHFLAVLANGVEVARGQFQLIV